MAVQLPLRIDIVSDVMCPWCAIGYNQLAQALKATGIAHEIHWQPFELNPDMPPEGRDRFSYLEEKYGSDRAKSDDTHARMTALGADLGFTFNFGEEFRVHNTFNSHQLLHWAGTHGRQHDLKLALLAAHFTDRRNLSDTDVLADVAGEIGLDRTEALAVLADQRHANDVRTAQAFWAKQGIQGVPAMIFDRKYLVTGAQGVENYTSILKQIVEEPA
ncbi:DsbA family oxidoreductase [Falsirhodobacter sp. alg1]|uniref:DsbA family oxidoreductase n=1 Tax=Falsirhodobacter sp. alg1 TaxID=1472418 RepID=UPI0005F037A6|nr:DsbA family oxidoreductase [Falsirhodobacter sp. alg1]